MKSERSTSAFGGQFRIGPLREVSEINVGSDVLHAGVVRKLRVADEALVKEKGAE